MQVKTLFIMKGILVMMFFALFGTTLPAQDDYQKDVFTAGNGNLEITFIAHGTLMMQYNNLVIHVDPVTMFGTDYTKMPKADLILITHAHGDHMDPEAIEQVRKEGTRIVVTEECAKSLGYGDVMSNGDQTSLDGITIDAVPAYNLTSAFHPKGVGNGYVLQFGNLKVYVAGDTENIPEMAELKDIDVAFLPMNLPYTMSPDMTAAAARSFRPAILYPYHFGETNTDELVELLKNDKDIEVRIRNF